MKKLTIVLSVALFLSLVSICFGKSSTLQNDLERSENYRTARSFERDVKNGKLKVRTDKAIENLITVATYELRKKGANLLADRISFEFDTRYKNFLSDSSRGVGDHEGVKWLLNVHEQIEFVLGEAICRALRMHDLWTLAHTIPVVFRCVDNVDQMEYMLHFVPFSGIVSYWVSATACTGATLGTGIGFLCGLVGMGVEQIVIRFVAPPLSVPLWKKACQK